MPFTVITLKKVPDSLRGDLTKWMQEIATGVYIGNFSTRVRENLWKRVCDSVGSGEATISFAFHNEIGYNFQTLNTDRYEVDFDGIPLVYIPVENDSHDRKSDDLKTGFSTAAHMHRSKKAAYPHKEGKAINTNEIDSKENGVNTKGQESYVVLDLETTGLNATTDEIIEIGAVKDDHGTISDFHALVSIDNPLPKDIVQLTGITDDMLRQGQNLKDVLPALVEFVGNKPIVGYNINFDLKFLNGALCRCGMSRLNNQVVDLIKIVRREQLFQENYRLETTLKSYGIADKVPHRALQDAQLILQLVKKVNVFGRLPE